jgi:hypothetical protein
MKVPIRLVPLMLAACVLQAQDLRVKYVAQDAVYINGGRAAGLAEAMKLEVHRAAADGSDQVIGTLSVISVANASAVCEIRSSTVPLAAGDRAVLAAEDAQKSQILRTAGAGAHYAQTITFSDGDPIDQEVRDYQPRPSLPEVNRIRGQIGFEYNGIRDQSGAGANFSEFGVVVRANMTRIGGSYWNLSGYNHFMFTSSGAQNATLNDLLNRTYHMALTYENPQSNWTMGFGRFYLPWASSLSTIDGGYVARRVARRVTVGMFAGTTPDPTSWNYAPNREEAGGFVSVEGGSYEGFKYMTTSGTGVSRLSWRPEREFLFFENTLSWKRFLSFYQSLEVDRFHPTVERPTATGTAVARSFVTLRFEPSRWVAFDLNDNYFHDFPVFDPRLVGTGLLDKVLFQGLSGGARVSLHWGAQVYFDLGRSKGNTDPTATWNYLGGISLNEIWHTGIRGDFHYTRFNGSYGQGNYKALTFSRQLSDTLRLEVQAGQQDFVSPLTSQTRARFVNGNLDWMFARHYFVGAGLTVYRGQAQNYTQNFFTMGYRF